MRNCASENLEIPGLVLPTHHPGMTELRHSASVASTVISGDSIFHRAAFTAQLAAEKFALRFMSGQFVGWTKALFAPCPPPKINSRA